MTENESPNPGVNDAAKEFEETELLERIIGRLDQEDLVLTGEECWVADTADPVEFTIEVDREGEPVARYVVRLSAEVRAL